MGTDIVMYEKAIDQAMPDIANILAATPGLPARSFKAAMMSQMVRSKAAEKLAECSTVSFLNCAATFAGLGLMPDGATGQAYMLPFKGIATPVIGYKGYNTLGDRAGRTIDGDVVREGDVFDWEKGTDPWVKHKAIAAPGARIIYAWASAMALDRKPLISIMPIMELETARNKSPAGNNSSSPWMDLSVGRPAMYAKTAKRRLGRGIPFYHGRAGGFIMADAMESQFDLTERPHFILPGQDGQLHVTDGITGQPVAITSKPEDENADPIEEFVLTAMISRDRGPQNFSNVQEWKMALLKIIDLNGGKEAALKGIQSANASYLAEASAHGFGDDAMQISTTISKALDKFPK